MTIPRSHRYFVAALVVYWLAMFVGTHYPKAPELLFNANDKLCHFAAHAGLACLLVSWWQLAPLGRRMSSLKIAAIAIALVAAYGAFDEITQIPVGRDCELLDWVADVSGGIVGSLSATLAFSLGRGLRPANRPPGS